MYKNSVNNYWDNEQPVIAKTDYNTLTYYPKAGKLQISTRDWADKDGTIKRGKTVGLDLTAIRQNADAMQIFRDIYEKKEDR